MLLDSNPNFSNPQSNSASLLNRTLYLIRHPDAHIFPADSLETFNLYKKFVENTIMELGQDWRIQSGLLAQEIMTEKSLTNDEFCIFNEFLAGFLRKRLGQEGTQIHTQTNKMMSQEEGQEEFLKYFNKSISKTTGQNLTENDFSSNLTFKTLSLGFYITANDIWTRIFKKYLQEVIEQKFNSFSLGHQSKLSYFGTLEVKLFAAQRWFKQQENQVRELLAPIQQKLENVTYRGPENLVNAIRLGSVIANVEQTVLKMSVESPEIKIRTFSLCTEFYLNIFLVWLIFSIKKSFNSSLFSPTCFVRYCDIIIGSKVQNYEEGTKTAGFHMVYKQFKILCDEEWKKLMKDYMIALNDDREVLKTLVARVGEKIKQRFEKQVEGRKILIK